MMTTQYNQPFTWPVQINSTMLGGTWAIVATTVGGALNPNIKKLFFETWEFSCFGVDQLNGNALNANDFVCHALVTSPVGFSNDQFWNRGVPINSANWYQKNASSYGQFVATIMNVDINCDLLLLPNVTSEIIINAVAGAVNNIDFVTFCQFTGWCELR